MENLFFKQNVSERSGVDRFVPPRKWVLEMGRRRSWHAGCEDINILDPDYLKQKKYKDHLDQVFGLNLQRRRSLDQPCYWPCNPRKKGFMTVADCVLDLPTYSSEDYLLDWSRKNVLVAGLSHTYYMFGWHEQMVLGRGIGASLIRSCKCDPAGDLLLLGMRNKDFEQHDTEYMKSIARKKCSCESLSPFEPCEITALDWSPTGNSFVIGCTYGRISSYTRDMRLISKFNISDHIPILTVRVSPDTRFVGAANMGSSSFHVLVWPYLKPILHMKSSCCIVKSLAWHPWRSALLGIGADVQDSRSQRNVGVVQLWDAPGSKFQGGSTEVHNQFLDTALFSHRTGEMVLNMWDPDAPSLDPTTPGSSTLVVMSNPQTVVDWSKHVLDRVRMMVFNPDGSKLALATDEEDLMIWNFLPEEKKKKHLDKSRRFYALPAYIDDVTSGFVIR